ncbi:hypothetical protein [Candidatus Thioglobus sp.]|uniref:hypothetical protein n=1 Tax=Candidatus Thioglobus sp. TaxID=2026721 RepID=UPI003D13B606
MDNQELSILNTPEELNNRASYLITNLHQYTFSNLPSVLDRIITEKTWAKLPTKFNNFGEYTLNQGVDGLGIDSNEKLWLLRCALDFESKHIVEWKDILVNVEQMTKFIPVDKRKNISLEKLSTTPGYQNKITYHPSQVSGKDKAILELNKKKKLYLSKIAKGAITKAEALEKIGITNKKKIAYNQTISSFKRLTKQQKTEFINWLKTEKFI